MNYGGQSMKGHLRFIDLWLLKAPLHLSHISSHEAVWVSEWVRATLEKGRIERENRTRQNYYYHLQRREKEAASFCSVCCFLFTQTANCCCCCSLVCLLQLRLGFLIIVAIVIRWRQQDACQQFVGCKKKKCPVQSTRARHQAPAWHTHTSACLPFGDAGGRGSSVFLVCRLFLPSFSLNGKTLSQTGWWNPIPPHACLAQKLWQWHSVRRRKKKKLYMCPSLSLYHIKYSIGSSRILKEKR